jgi:hypothetical protein
MFCTHLGVLEEVSSAMAKARDELDEVKSIMGVPAFRNDPAPCATRSNQHDFHAGLAVRSIGQSSILNVRRRCRLSPLAHMSLSNCISLPLLVASRYWGQSVIAADSAQSADYPS